MNLAYFKMSKKLLLAAVTTFLSMTVCVAFYFDGSLAGARPYYFGTVVIYSIFAYPLSVAIVFWDHCSSRALKHCSAGTGLIITLILVWSLGPVAALSSDFKTSAGHCLTNGFTSDCVPFSQVS